MNCDCICFMTCLAKLDHPQGHGNHDKAVLKCANVPFLNLSCIGSQGNDVHVSCGRMLSVPPGNTLRLLDALECASTQTRVSEPVH